MTDDNARDKDLIRAYLDAVGVLDVDAVAPLFHDEGRVVLPYAPPGVPPVIQGRAAIDDYYQALPQLATALKFANYQIDALETPGHYLARYSSDSSMVATGRPYANTYVTLVIIQDGRILELSEHFNPIPLVEALGGTVTMPAS